MISQTAIIYNLIKQNKYMSLDDVHHAAIALHMKARSIERNLNNSRCPSWIITVYDEKNQIKGYKFKRQVKVIV